MGPRYLYVVQKLDWQYQDDFYMIEDELPTRAFTRRGDAEAFRRKMEIEARRAWEAEARDRDRRGDTDAFFEVVAVEWEGADA
jgi:hypothetical protein